ncbi:MAG: HupE/UreJ family protein [Methylomonas sp.]|jgi:hypothetical protein
MKSLLLVLVFSLSFNAQAHKPSDSYLALTVDGRQLHGQWDIALRDLEYAIGLDADNDGAITWLELRERRTDVFAYALNRLSISANQQTCALTPSDIMADEHSDGHYAVLIFQGVCLAEIKQLAVNYRLFFDLDPQHRGLLKLTDGAHTDTAIFSPEHVDLAFTLNSPDRPIQELFNFAYEGVGHIWAGFDHLLFLLSLILPAALVRKNAGWQPKPRLSLVFWDVFKVVTAFTLAHSITLSLTALQFIALPSRWIESAIAASVLFAALNNIYPRFIDRRAWFAFGFGLIHGMGIAGVLLDMGLADGQRVLSLLGFNLGVEAGQLAVVSVALPLIAWLSRYRYYPILVLKSGSIAIAGIALVWLAERSLDFQINIF